MIEIPTTLVKVAHGHVFIHWIVLVTAAFIFVLWVTNLDQRLKRLERRR